MDPISAILAGDWGSVTGWGLWIGETVVLVTGAFREWWVPGARARRTEELLDKALTTIAGLNEQNGKLVTGNELTKHYFESFVPQKGASKVEREEGGSST